jgi:hypothetical protein
MQNLSHFVEFRGNFAYCFSWVECKHVMTLCEVYHSFVAGCPGSSFHTWKSTVVSHYLFVNIIL